MELEQIPKNDRSIITQKIIISLQSYMIANKGTD